MEKLLSELSNEGQQGFSLPENDLGKGIMLSVPIELLRENPPALPQISEPDIRRHFTRLSRKNYALSIQFYPLGSCTMKYNPPVNEKISLLSGFSSIHPLQDESTVQGMLELLYDLERSLCEICGMDKFTLQPAAGAQGEFAGLLIINAHFKDKKEKRTKIIVPDSAHGTNPASAALAGFEIVPLKSESDGMINIETLKAAMTGEIAAIMLTVPNTLGVFEKNILEIADIVHKNGSLLYYDGANLNAILGHARPGDFGFDIVHVNLHKTFSTPHGGGGPGSGPVGVKKSLEKFLPVPEIRKKDNPIPTFGRHSINDIKGVVNRDSIKNTKEVDTFFLDYDMPLSIGKVRSFYGNIPVLVKAYAYIVALGKSGLRKVSEYAVLNANYLLSKLGNHLPAPAGNHCMHEFVLSAKPYAEKGVRALDMAKRLLDYGYYAPTIYFPLIVEEAMMFEPTETESKAELDNFAETMVKILKEAEEKPELVKSAPHTTTVTRLNEVEAARKPVLKWQDII